MQSMVDRLLKEIARVTGGHRSDVSMDLDGNVALIDGQLFRADCVLEACGNVPDGVHVPPADLWRDVIGHCRTER